MKTDAKLQVQEIFNASMDENFGTGIPRTFDAYKNEEKQPVFEATENFFCVTLPNLNYLENDQINELDLKY